MATERKDALILEFLDETDLALPPAVIHYNMERAYRLTFKLNTTRRRLNELESEGFVRRLDVGRGYFEITDAGREWYKDVD